MRAKECSLSKSFPFYSVIEKELLAVSNSLPNILLFSLSRKKPPKWWCVEQIESQNTADKAIFRLYCFYSQFVVNLDALDKTQWNSYSILKHSSIFYGIDCALMTFQMDWKSIHSVPALRCALNINRIPGAFFWCDLVHLPHAVI